MNPVVILRTKVVLSVIISSVDVQRAGVTLVHVVHCLLHNQQVNCKMA